MNTTEAQRMALREMGEWGLIEKGWTFRFDNAKTRAGLCSYSKKVISLSKPLTAIWDESDVLDTILHEIAHALTGYLPNEGHHGPSWRRACIIVGASTDRCYGGDLPKVDAPWTGQCSNRECDVTFTRHREPTVAQTCGAHGNGFDLDNLVLWEDKNGMPPGRKWARSMLMADMMADA